MQDVVIIGAGGFARETLDVFDAINDVKPTYNVLGYIVEKGFGSPDTLINDKPILGDFDWFTNHKNVLAVCGVGSPEIRRRLVYQVMENGIRFTNAIHPSVIKTKWMSIGEGSIVTAGCILSNQIIIGNHVHINPGSVIGHDVVFEDFVSIAPGVRISGNITIKTGAYIGTGTSVIEKKTIGAWSIVGAGSTIIKDVEANTTVVGVPGRVIKKRDEGWYNS